MTWAKEENLRAAGRRSQESLNHMPVLKLELRNDDRGLINARSRKGRAESGACDKCVHVFLVFVCNTQRYNSCKMVGQRFTTSFVMWCMSEATLTKMSLTRKKTRKGKT